MSSTTLAVALAPSGRRRAIGYRVALVVASSWLVAGLAQLHIRLPFTPVPVTGQTLGVLLVGACLGSRLGAASMGLYLAQGALGLPFFSGGSSGIELLGPASATGGYLWGFVAASFVVGRLAEREWDRSLWHAVLAMAVGEVILYVIGVVWLSRALDVSIREAVRLGFTPFILGDALKMLLAGVALPASWGLVGRQTSRPRPGRT